jgi:DNA replication licensing factor MCM6
MASPMDAVPTSDHFPESSVRNGSSKRRSLQRGSSARPGGPPSESLAPQSEDEGFADDQIPISSNRPRNPLDRPVTKVEDKVGLVVQDHFERFLET